jgi:MtN3 and saliva related transmembrane protein
MDRTVLIGYIAGTLTTISFIPQVLRTWRLKETKDFSAFMLLLLATGIFLWMLYGLWTWSPPIIAANTITFVLVAFLFWMKLRYK